MTRSSFSESASARGALARNPQDDLAELFARLEPLVRSGGVCEREYVVDDRADAAGGDQLVHRFEVLARAHRRAVHGQLLPPNPVELGRRVRSGGRAAYRDAARLTGGVERA